MYGFAGRSFNFIGDPGKIYNIISTQNMQVGLQSPGAHKRPAGWTVMQSLLLTDQRALECTLRMIDSLCAEVHLNCSYNANC